MLFCLLDRRFRVFASDRYDLLFPRPQHSQSFPFPSVPSNYLTPVGAVCDVSRDLVPIPPKPNFTALYIWCLAPNWAPVFIRSRASTLHRNCVLETASKDPQVRHSYGACLPSRAWTGCTGSGGTCTVGVFLWSLRGGGRGRFGAGRTALPGFLVLRLAALFLGFRGGALFLGIPIPTLLPPPKSITSRFHLPHQAAGAGHADPGSGG